MDSEPRSLGGEGRGSVGQAARVALVVIGLWAVANALWLARDFVFIAFLGVLLGTFVSIFVDLLQRARVPRPLGALAVALCGLAVLSGIGLVVWPTLRDQLSALAQDLPRALERAFGWLGQQYAAMTGELTDEPRSLPHDLRDELSAGAARLASGVLPVLGTIGGALAALFVVGFGGLYLSIETHLFRTGVLRLLPPSGRARADLALARMGTTLRKWLLGTVINMVVVGALTTLGLRLLGVPSALALGLIAGVLEFVPIFGPVLAAVPAVAVALVSSPRLALAVLLLFVVIQQLESNLLTPLVMKGVVKLPPALSIGFQLLMSILFGFIGLLVAVPVLAVLVVAVTSLFVEPREEQSTVVVRSSR